MTVIQETRRIPEYFTLQQRQFIEAVATGRHLYLRATAGSGKTSTIQEAAWHVRDRERPVAYFVYSRAAKESLGDHFPDFVRVSTIHASGYGQLVRLRKGKLEIDTDKSLRLARLLYPEFKIFMHRKLAKLWGELREICIFELSEEQLEHFAAAFELDTVFVRNVFERFLQASLGDWHSGGNPDFTDQLWLPLVLKQGKAVFGAVFVDEAQDLTPLRQAYVAHVLGLGTAGEGQLVLVGDSDQAIFQYSGADPMGMARMAKQVGAVQYPLSVSWRCPVSHVAIARHATPFIEAAPSAIQGSVEHVRASELSGLLKKGQTVLCRTNAPLIGLALELLAAQVSVDLRGRDLDKLLTRAVRDVYGAKTSFSVYRVRERLSVALQARLKPLIYARDQGDKDAKRRIQEEKDLFECVTLLMSEVSRKMLGVSVLLQDVLNLITKLCAPGGDVLLCTIHRSKGLEWRDVILLFPERLPAVFGAFDEERCILFVALTRSKETLRFAYGEKAWAEGWCVQPYSEESGSWRWLHEDEQGSEDKGVEQKGDFVELVTEGLRPPTEVYLEQSRQAQAVFRGECLSTPIVQPALRSSSSSLSASDRERLLSAQAALSRRRSGDLQCHVSAQVAWPFTPYTELAAFYTGEAVNASQSVAEVRQLMNLLNRCGRFVVQTWAKEVLEALRGCGEQHMVMVSEQVSCQLGRLVRAGGRLAVEQNPFLHVIMPLESGSFELCAAGAQRRTGGMLTAEVRGSELTFDLYTGELIGQEFSLSAPALHFSGLLYVQAEEPGQRHSA